MQKNILFWGRSLEYEVKGQGLPVMLLHGFMEDRAIWDLLLAGIEDKYCWLIPDLPGSGRSVYNENLHSLSDFSEAIHAIANQEGIQQLVLIGHSMGGYISLAFAEKYPSAVRALGLFHSSGYEDSEEKKEVRGKNIRFILKNGSALFLEQAIPGLFGERYQTEHPDKLRKRIADYADFKPAALIQYLQAMKQRPQTTGVLKTIDRPVLFIMGEEDKAVPLKDSLEQCHLPQISYIHILTSAAHMGMIENTSLCNSFVDRFLEQMPV